jgi:hypothetical protein
VLKHENAAKYPDDEIQEMALSKMKCADKLFNEIVDEYDILRSEMIVASLGRAVAGQIDLLCRKKHNNRLALFDYKTNQEIKFENRFQRCLKPIDHFEHCNFIEYSLQLGLYEMIAQEEGYFNDLDWDGSPIEKFIVHITENPDDGMIYPCADVSGEMKVMLDSQKKATQLSLFD